MIYKSRYFVQTFSSSKYYVNKIFPNDIIGEINVTLFATKY